MNRYITLILVLLLTVSTHAQKRISHEYNDVSLSDALRQLSEQQTDYTIYFLYNELEDFRITTTVKNKHLPEAIQQMIGFYPIRVSTSTDKDGKKIFVECIHKTDHHLMGIIIDEQGQPLAYANVAILNPVDSTQLGGGVSNESGYFVIPTEANRVIVKCSFVGYRTYYHSCEVGDIGTIQMRPAEYTINGVTIEGTHIMNYVDKSVHTFTIEQIEQARNVRDLLEHVEDLKVNPVSNKIQRMDGGSVKILINGIAASDIDLKGIPANKISKVEYYNIPPARYADAGALVNVITKRLDTGINIGIEARTAFTTGFTNDEAYLNLTSGNHQLSLSYTFSLRDYTKRFGEQTYNYTLENNIPDGTAKVPTAYCNYQKQTHDKFGYTWNDPVIKYTYNKPDDLAVQIVATPHFNHIHSDGQSNIQDNSSHTASIEGKGDFGSRMSTFGPSLNVYVQKTLPKNQELSIDLVGTYYHNNSKNWDEERAVTDGEIWLADNQEQQNNKYSFIGELAYTKKWGKSSLSLGYRGSFGRSNATISNVLSDYKEYEYSSASYQHYMYAEYSGIIGKLMYRIGAGATQVTQDNTDAHDSHWLFTPKLILSTNLSKTMNLQWVTSSKSNTPPISGLSNNASLVIPRVLSIGNPYLKSYNTYESELIHKWNLGWLQTQISLSYNYTDAPINRYYTQQEINGQQYIVGTNENANYSSELGGSYQLVFSPLKSQILTLTLRGYVTRQTVSSPIIGHYHHTWTPLYFVVQFRKGNWGATYVGNIVSKRLNGSTLDAGENQSYLQVYWQKKNWRIFAADYWLFTRSRYSGYSMPTSILQSTYKTWIDDNKSMLVLGFSYDFSTGKELKINRKLQNKDSDTGSF